MRGVSLIQAAYKALHPWTAFPATILSFTGKGLSAPSFLFLAYPWVSLKPGAELPSLLISVIFLLIIIVLSSRLNKGSSVTPAPPSLLFSIFSRCTHTFVAEDFNIECCLVHQSQWIFWPCSFRSPYIKLRHILPSLWFRLQVVLLFRTLQSSIYVYTSARISTVFCQCTNSQTLFHFLAFTQLYLDIKEMLAMVPWNNQSSLHRNDTMEEAIAVVA